MLRDLSTNDWFTLSLILVGLGFILLRQINLIKYHKFLQLLYSKVYFKVKLKESHLFTGFELVAFLVANLIFAQACYAYIIKNVEENLITFSPFINIALIFALLCVFSFLKIYLEKLVNFCFADHQLLKVYVFYKQMIWSYATYLSLPILIFYMYFPESTYYILLMSFAVMAIFYSLNIIYFIYKNRKQVFGNWYYFILYLCALEIAPYYFMYKMLVIA